MYVLTVVIDSAPYVTRFKYLYDRYANHLVEYVTLALIIYLSNHASVYILL